MNAPLAEFVRFFTEDKMMLHGLLWQPAGKSRVVALYVPGMTGNFASPQEMNGFVTPLLEAGYAVLAVNLRIVSPPGLVHSRFEDCVPDLAAAVQFLQSRDFTSIVLIGDSLGSARCTYFWHQQKPESVQALVLLAAVPSPYEEARQRWNETERQRFDGHLKRVRELLAAGKPQETVFYPEFQPGRGIALSAATWLNTFGPPPECNASTVKFLPEVTIPVLVLHGEKDEISVPESARAVFDAASAAPRRDLLWADAGHFFFTPEEAMRYSRPLADWLRSVAPP